VTRLCRLFAVTRAGFYAWRRRPVSARARQDRGLLEEMRAIFERSGGTYGSTLVTIYAEGLIQPLSVDI
jgi:putative transposase